MTAHGGYRSIRFYSLLLIVLLTVLTAGFMVNLHYIVNLALKNERLHLVGFARSAALLLENELSGRLTGTLSPETIRNLRGMLLHFEYDSGFRIYIVSPSQAVRLFPEKVGWDESGVFRYGAQVWQKGWQGKSGFTAPYTTSDGVKALAFIQPIPMGVRNPRKLVVVERNLRFSLVMQRLEKALMAIIIIGWLGGCFIIFKYAQALKSSFQSLASVIARFKPPGKRDAPPGDPDPIRNAIRIFQQTVHQLREKERQLEEMNAVLKDRSRIPEEFRESALATVNSGILTFDTHRRILAVTSEARALLGLGDTALDGADCEKVFGGNSIICTLLTDALKYKRTVRNRQWRWQLPGAPPKWLSISTNLLKTQTGVLSGAGFLIQDITPLKQLELRMREQEHLAALGELSAGIAHEFRNPLGVIRGNADLLSAELPPGEHLEIIQEIKHEVSNLDRIIGDFLKFARPAPLHISPVNPRACLEKITRQYGAATGTAARISLDSTEPLPQVHLDEQLFQQVVQNILDNAFQAMGENGCVRMTVIPAEDPESGENGIRIRIEDEGPGVPPDNFDNLFKPFFTTKTTGTGLGLAIAKKLVALHHGNIAFDPTVMRGAAVVIFLPAEYDPHRTQKIKRNGVHPAG